MSSISLASPNHDPLRQRCFLLSLATHGLLILALLGWDSMMRWWQQRLTVIPEQSEAAPTRVVYVPMGGDPITPDMLPSLSSLPTPEDGMQALRPRLDEVRPEGQGTGSRGGSGDAIDTPLLPPAMALPYHSDQDQGGGSPVLEARQRREQEANYLLMGFLLRHYRNHWKPIYGHRLPRRTIYLWIEHDNSRVLRANFAGTSSTGITELDHAILNWLVADNRIDLSDLRDSEPRLLMSIDLYQAHR